MSRGSTWMSPESNDAGEERTKRRPQRRRKISQNTILIGGFTLLIGFEAVSMIMTPTPTAIAIIRIVLTVLLMAAVAMGKVWARILMSVLLLMGGSIGLLAFGELIEQGAEGLVVIAAFVFHVGFGLFLFFACDRDAESVQ
jgi:4-hydroxybenzoate polyprenyltransferase